MRDFMIRADRPHVRVVRTTTQIVKIVVASYVLLSLALLTAWFAFGPAVVLVP